jgi:TIR domain
LADLDHYLSTGRKTPLALTDDARAVMELIERTGDRLDIAPYEETYVYALISRCPEFRAAIDANGGSSTATRTIFYRQLRDFPWESYDEASLFSEPGERSQFVEAAIAAANGRQTISGVDIALGVLAVYDRACPPMQSNAGFYDPRMQTPYNTLAHIISRYSRSLYVSFDALREHLRKPKSPRPLRVFISYARPDAKAARRLAARLRQLDFEVWIDSASLSAGDDWRAAISTAIRNADAVVICLSTSSVSRRGFVQKEIALALETAELMPEEMRFVIPVRLDDCQRPVRLERWHAVDLFRRGGFRAVCESLRHPPSGLESCLS